MKKLVLLLVVALLALTSCSSTGADNSAKKYSVGSYSITSPIADRNLVNGEKVQMNTTMATVIVADEKIVNVNIDTAQTEVKIDDAGKVTVPAETPTKKEKKDAYGMKKASEIGKEWYEQIEALEEALIGKTLEEVNNFELTETGHAADADLVSSVSISINGFLEVVAKAMEVAKEVEGAVAKVGSSVITAVEDRAVAEDKNGRVTFNTNYGHVVLDADGKVLQAFVDNNQNRLEYNATGEWQEFKALDSKKILKEAYNMKGNSGIDKEWYEQAEALEEWMVGQTIEEINAAEKDETGHLTDADLTSSVTISVNDYQAVVTKAAENAVDVK